LYLYITELVESVKEDLDYHLNPKSRLMLLDAEANRFAVFRSTGGIFQDDRMLPPPPFGPGGVVDIHEVSCPTACPRCARPCNASRLYVATSSDYAI